MIRINLILILFLFFCQQFLFAQEKAVVKGKITGVDNKPLEFVSVGVFDDGKPYGTTSVAQGTYAVKVSPNKKIRISFSFTGYGLVEDTLMLKPGEEFVLNKKLSEILIKIEGPTIVENDRKNTTFVYINPAIATIIPGVSGGVEGVIKTFSGVSSNNELSAQYSVRGGNFDENLVYINGIEIYRPLLVKSGEQEGLSFINPDLVSMINFSTGGFEAKYGDKMSSVLDIKYKVPTAFEGSLAVDLTGASMHLEGAAADNKLKFLFGVRQKSNQYILNSMAAEADYKPSFTDVQGLVSYDISDKFELSFLGNYSRNVFNVWPQSSETVIGGLGETKKYVVYFEGQELDKYNSLFGAATLTHKFNRNVINKLTFSAYQSQERESYDILGEYFIGDVQLDAASGGMGGMTDVAGIGAYLEHARNFLYANVFSLDYQTILSTEKIQWQWGVSYKYQYVNDDLNEWKLVDSTDYSLPNFHSEFGDSNVVSFFPVLQNNYKAKNELTSNYVNGFAQMGFNMFDNKQYYATVGMRFSYLDFNNELLWSPRASLSYAPKKYENLFFRFSTGVYYQTPFYREYRTLTGELNDDIKSQKSIHFILSNDYFFPLFGRSFKLTSEVYYKLLQDIIPYEIDNLRIKYMGRNAGKGYVTGIDLRLFGELVKGVDSWITFSLMEAKENITFADDKGNKITTGYIPMPTDRRVNFSMFVQDYFMNNKNIKVNLTLLFGTGVPSGASNALTEIELMKNRNDFRLPAYQRVDIGFSFSLKRKSKQNFIKASWLTAEIFNLFDFRNVISYSWVEDFSGNMSAIPNYLTPRLLNIKLNIKF